MNSLHRYNCKFGIGESIGRVVFGALAVVVLAILSVPIGCLILAIACEKRRLPWEGRQVT